MANTLIKVGTLAKKTGLTVRTLHYYEEIGILMPAQRSEKGYRLYGLEEIERLQKILSLQHLGFPLDEIRKLLDQTGYSLGEVLDLHIARLQEQIKTQHELLSQLQSISQHLQLEQDVSIDELIQTIRVTKMYEKYYSEEQLETLKQRREALGEEGMQKGQQDWTDLNNAFRIEMEKGTDPADEKVQALVAKMDELIQAFTGGDPGIAKSLGNMYKNEDPEKVSQGAMDRALFEYVGKARAAGTK